ncbi:spore germination protein [Virgibacillus siamensis]|uniref:spore germination protein n=1 Tax=Virgibacillus siamensis TaxID=480071 RepID=UPI000984232B|nr:spore germination protein [Virgibacillus siamensis]
MGFFSRKKKKNNEHENFTLDIYKSLDKNISNLKNMLEEPNDLVIREFTAGKTDHKCALAFIDGLINNDLVNDNVLKNLQVMAEWKELPATSSDLFHAIKTELISVSDVEIGKNLDDVSNAMLYGSAILYIDGFSKVLMMDVKGWQSRSIEQPPSETIIRGPREGFIENFRTNMVLIRRYIRDPNLRFKTYQVGRRSKKNLAVVYVDGIIHPDLLKEVQRRLESIDMDNAPESSYIEQWIEDSFLSPFPQMLNTERPDAVAKAVLEGKFAIILDGTPFVLIAPVTIGNTLQAPEDYYERWSLGSTIRMLRYLAAFLAMFMPALYIALVSYHQGMIPTKLAFSIAASREGVPFPAVVEALLMALTMEMLREASVRLPKAIGQTIGIIGGLVIGEAAVNAGIVSPIMVIVVALTAIASFTIPAYSVAISFRMLRFGVMIAAAVFGLYGIILAYIMINIHIVNLRSIGVPYSSPFAPTFIRDWKDLVFRAPIPLLDERPDYLLPDDKKSADKRGKR